MANDTFTRSKYTSSQPAVASGVDASNRLKARAALREAAPGGLRAQQAAAGQVAEAQGAAAVEGAKATIDAAKAGATNDVAAAQVSAGEAEADRRLRLGERRAAFDRQLGALGLKVDRESFNADLKFRRDESGRLALNQRQLADWAATSARSREDFLDKQQGVELAHQRRTELLRTAQARIDQTLKMEADGQIAALDRVTKERLVRAKADLEQKLARETADAANRQATWTTAGTLIGVGAGALIGGPAGAAAGGAIGGGVGGLAAAKTSQA